MCSFDKSVVLAISACRAERAMHMVFLTLIK